MAHKPDAKKTEANHKHVRHTARGQKRACQVKGCKNAYRAKGYCNSHYKIWRGGTFGKARYNICSKEACRKPQEQEGLCGTHWAEKRKPGEAAPAAPPAAPAAPAAG